METWLTSDFHFGHNKDFIYAARGFETVEDMNKILLENFNSVVKPEDEVYILGDLILGNSAETIKYIEALNGRLHIVRGNHDSDQRWQMYHNLPNVVELQNAIYLKYKGHHFYLSHFPTMTSNLDYDKPLKQRTLNICGHTHTTDPWHDGPLIYHCEVDAHGGLPVTLDKILQEFYNKAKGEDMKCLLL